MTYRHLQKRLRETRKLEETLTLASQIWLADSRITEVSCFSCDAFFFRAFIYFLLDLIRVISRTSPHSL